jgi:hypothetical protein
VREVLIDRVATAVRFVDAASSRPIAAELELSAGVRVDWRRNLGGDYVLWRAEGLDRYTGHDASLDDEALEAVFEAPPGTPAAETVSLAIDVRDPSRAYLPRRFRLALPPTSANLFTPHVVPLFPDASRARMAGATLYVSVRDASGRGVPGALVTVHRGTATLVRAMSGPLGDAFVALPALASFTPGDEDGDVMEQDHALRLEARVARARLVLGDAGWTLDRPLDPDPGGDFAPGPADSDDDITASVGGRNEYVLGVSLP